MNKFICIALCLTAVLGVSQAANECYSCSSIISSSCETFDKDAPPPKSGSAFDCAYCSKVVTKGTINSVTRACLPACSPSKVGSISTHCCKGNLCNGASAPGLSLFLGGLAALLGLSLTRL